MKTKYEQQMKKGVLEMLVLSLLQDSRKYGYQLISELREKSQGLLVLKEGTLYPILYRLEDDGLVVAHRSEPQGREPSRKYYEITEEGRITLKEMQKLWGDFAACVETILAEKQSDGGMQ